MDEIVSILISPSDLITWIFLAAIVGYILRLRKTPTILCLFAVSIYFVLGSGPVSQLLLSTLEYRYSSYTVSDDTDSKSTIVVLTGSAEAKPGTPISSHLNPSSVYRVLEARRIYLSHPESTIIISGLGSTPSILKEALLNLDIPESQIVLDNKSNTTHESAINLKNILPEDKPFILVTSAGHMPRSIATFEHQGLKPVPAPTEFISRQNIFAAQYLPTPRHMVYSELAIHEYIGMFWYRMTGRM